MRRLAMIAALSASLLATSGAAYAARKVAVTTQTNPSAPPRDTSTPPRPPASLPPLPPVSPR